MCGKYGVQGYPTLKFFLDGSVYEYEGARKAESIIEFMENMKLPVLNYDKQVDAGKIWFEYFTNDVEADSSLFENQKGKVQIKTSRGQ